MFSSRSLAGLLRSPARKTIWVLLTMAVPCTALSASTNPRAEPGLGDPPVTSDAIAPDATPHFDMQQRFYALRGQRPVWTDIASVKSLAAALEGLSSDGLTPSDYRPRQLVIEGQQALASGPGSAALRAFEHKATSTLLTAMTHLQRGKVDPQRIDRDWEVNPTPPIFDLVSMSHELDKGNVEAVIELARPDHQPYRQLRTALARYQRIAQQGGWPMLPLRKEPLRPGDHDQDVALLRQRLGMEGDTQVVAADTGHYPQIRLDTRDAEAYDPQLAEAVRRFQRHHLLADDGVVGSDTRLALNVPVSRRIEQIRVNMERTRWLLHGLPDSFVLVDIAGYQLSYFRPDGQVWRSRIVVGQPYRRTPTLRSEITYLTLNPTWTVPPTIYREDILPRTRHDPGYLASRGLYPLTPSGQRLDPNSVDWSNPGSVMLRQGAGPGNPLGQVVVRFPNDHLVYLHDTPSRHQFNRVQRALSSGCVRVEGVTQLAQMLFDDSGTSANISKLLADGKTRNIALERHIPVVLDYWTIQPLADGSLVFRPDIYHRDTDVMAELDRPLIF